MLTAAHHKSFVLSLDTSSLRPVREKTKATRSANRLTWPSHTIPCILIYVIFQRCFIDKSCPAQDGKICEKRAMLCVEPNFARGASTPEHTVEELSDLVSGCKAIQLPIR